MSLMCCLLGWLCVEPAASTQPLAELCWGCRGGAVGTGTVSWHSAGQCRSCPSPATPPSDPLSILCAARPRRGSTLRSPPATEHGSLHKHHLSFSKLQPQGGEDVKGIYKCLKSREPRHRDPSPKLHLSTALARNRLVPRSSFLLWMIFGSTEKHSHPKRCLEVKYEGDDSPHEKSWGFVVPPCSERRCRQLERGRGHPAACPRSPPSTRLLPGCPSSVGLLLFQVISLILASTLKVLLQAPQLPHSS